MILQTDDRNREEGNLIESVSRSFMDLMVRMTETTLVNVTWIDWFYFRSTAFIFTGITGSDTVSSNISPPSLYKLKFVLLKVKVLSNLELLDLRPHFLITSKSN